MELVLCDITSIGVCEYLKGITVKGDPVKVFIRYQARCMPRTHGSVKHQRFAL